MRKYIENLQAATAAERVINQQARDLAATHQRAERAIRGLRPSSPMHLRAVAAARKAGVAYERVGLGEERAAAKRARRAAESELIAAALDWDIQSFPL